MKSPPKSIPSKNDHQQMTTKNFLPKNEHKNLMMMMNLGGYFWSSLVNNNHQE